MFTDASMTVKLTEDTSNIAFGPAPLNDFIINPGRSPGFLGYNLQGPFGPILGSEGAGIGPENVFPTTAGNLHYTIAASSGPQHSPPR